jgi:RimJ/RimL family protein N-acetyltransferase
MLRGRRVLLRSITREDLPSLCAFNNDIEVELAGGGDPPMPQSLERLQAEFDRSISNGGRDGSSFVIDTDGRVIGQCALFNMDHVAMTCELGITIGDRDYWGHGYGREAVSLLLYYAFRLQNYRKVWLRVHGKNERAQRSYEACGFVVEGRLRAQVWSNGEYDDLIYMGILRVEWERLMNSKETQERRVLF